MVVGGGSEWCLMVVMDGDWSWLSWVVLVCGGGLRWWLIVVGGGAAAAG